MTKQISEQEYATEVEQFKGWVLIDFFAEWCGPCRMVPPILEEIGKARPDLKIVKVNVDQAQNLAQKFNIMSIPSLILFKDGKPVNTWVGLRPKGLLIQEIEKAMGPAA